MSVSHREPLGTIAGAPPIDTLDSLREHLQWAIELEHATLPPYLCALYSLDPERNPEAAEVVGSVFVEEMLHLALAANLLNAVGGRPQLDTPEMLPPHPRPLPHGSLELSLVPFGPEALEMFLRIEQPAPPGAPAEGDDYETIGQFYDAIEQGLRHLCDRLGEQEVFCGDPARQVTAAHFRHTAGRLVAVDDLESALAALEEIVEQGEGTARARSGTATRTSSTPTATRSRTTTASRSSSSAGATSAATPRSPGPPARRSPSTRTACTRCGPTRACPTTLPAARSERRRTSSTTPTAPSCTCWSRRSTAARSCSRPPPARCTRSRRRPRP